MDAMGYKGFGVGLKTEKQNWMMDEQIIQTNWIASRYGNDTLNLKNMHCWTRHSILRIPYTYIYNLLRVILGSWNLFAVLTIALPAKNVAQLLYLRNSPPFINCDNKDYKLLYKLMTNFCDDRGISNWTRLQKFHRNSSYDSLTYTIRFWYVQ